MTDKIDFSCIDRNRTVEIKNNKIDSSELLCKAKELIIVHNNEEYRLRLTKNCKLLLIK